MPVDPLPILIDTASGTYGHIQLGLGSVEVSGAFTFVATFKLHTGGQDTDVIVAVRDAAGTALVAFQVDALKPALARNNETQLRETTTNSLTRDHWVTLAISKASGTQTPRAHIFDHDGAATWIHENLNGTMANPTGTEASVEFGRWYNSGTPFNWFKGYLAAAAVFGSALSDANCETLDDDFDAWVALSPQAMWIANGSTPIVDEIGASDETARSADVTDASGTQTSPIEWGSLTLDNCLPDADVTTTGWTTTPLFSKVNDSSDATVIQATAS